MHLIVMFRAFDLDSSNSLSPDEIFKIYKASLNSKGHTIEDDEVIVISERRQIDLILGNANGEADISRIG